MIYHLNHRLQSNGNDPNEGDIKLNSMRYWFILFICLLTNLVFAQPGKVPQEIVDGKKYYIHVVKPGNTLWWIHETYNVSVDEIVKLNPGSEKGVSVGQKIRVPVQSQMTTYTVLPQESLYSLSQKFEIPVDSLINWNPGSENGLKVGQVLNINSANGDKGVQGKTQQAPIPAKVVDSNKLDNKVVKPEVKSPEVKSPEVYKHEVKTSDVKTSEVKTSEVKTTEVKTPEVKSPEVKSPEVKTTEV